MSGYKYKVTMIVPIYNMQNFLAECLDSLAEQTIEQGQMEVLLIDDGSVDDSMTIMKKYAEKYPYMKIFHKENEGLSMTRNYGIARAQGKYIMYIDADDTISPETVKSVAKFFDEHYDEVDLVTYKEIPIKNGMPVKPHFRYNTLHHSGVYDLSELQNAFITQTRVNICVKNKGKQNILFDTNREFRHEDQKYCTQILQEKMKIGYCNKGMYYYLHQPESIVRTFFYAYYIFESTMKYWEDLFADYDGREIPKYIQALYLHDVSWKTRSDILLPYHYGEEEFNHAKQRILRLLNKVDDDVILLHPGVDNFHRHYFINLKDNNDITMLSGPNNIAITNHGSLVYTAKRIEIIIRYFKVKNGKLRIIAFIKSALFSYMDQPRLYMIKNKKYDHAEEIDLRDASWNYYRAKTETNHFFLFEIEQDLKNLKSLEFEIEINENRYNTFFYFMPWTPFRNKIKKKEYYKDGKHFEFGTGILYIDNEKPLEKKQYLKKIRQRFRKTNKRKWLIRNICSRRIKRYENVWLYYDCKGVKRDNGYYQFIHDFDKHDGVRRYYVVNDDLYKVRKLFNFWQRKRLVRFGSLKHKFLFLKAQKIITAFIELNNYSPFTNKQFMQYSDISNHPDLIYLQHGVLHCHVPWKYSLDRLGVDKEVISTPFERENLINNYRFTDKHLIPCGMPRYDFINVDEQPVNRILFAPSWRKYLVGMEGTEWVTVESKFIGSKFFEETSKFLNSQELHDLLEKHDFYLDFKLHPILERYQHLYEIKNDRVTMAESVISETSYKIFMTDFSSFVFDFVYLEKPIVYFLPDNDMFRAGLNDYRDVDIPLEDAFGDLALTAEEAVEALQRIFANDCKPLPKYAEKMDGFFYYKDNHQMDRLYDALMED